MDALPVRPTPAVIRIAAITGALLLVPLVAMWFTDEVDWGLGDFVVAGLLLGGGGLASERLGRGRGPAHRLAIGITVAGVVVLVWIGLAVG